MNLSDATFLSQLEQRTQRVKITLANLEAERVRIEGLIARLQPLVPHYDALLAAERQIDEASIELDELGGDSPGGHSESFAPEHLRSESSPAGEPSGGEEQSGDWQPSGWHAAQESSSESHWTG